MNDYKAAFDAFAAGYAAAFAAGYADNNARMREESKAIGEIEMHILFGADDPSTWPDFDPSEWYVEEGEWHRLAPDPYVEASRRRRDAARERAAYDADAVQGKTRFAAALTPQPKFMTADFSLDLLSAFATAYAIGAADAAGTWHDSLVPGSLSSILSMGDLYDAAGVPPEVKGAILAIRESESAMSLPLALSDEAEAAARQKAIDAVENAPEIGFIGRLFPVGDEACRVYDHGYDDGYGTGGDTAYDTARQAAYDAVLAACDGNTDIAEQVVSAISEAQASAAETAMRQEPESRRRFSALYQDAVRKSALHEAWINDDALPF